MIVPRSRRLRRITQNVPGQARCFDHNRPAIDLDSVSLPLSPMLFAVHILRLLVLAERDKAAVPEAINPPRRRPDAATRSCAVQGGLIVSSVSNVG
jgi:hypothetical protein